jgi:hypothetical protein
MTTARLTTAERKIFTSKSVDSWGVKPDGTTGVTGSVKLQEPALGTVDQRLSIILARLGKGNGIPRNLRGPKAKRQTTITKRCTAGERIAFGRTPHDGKIAASQLGEPALGSLEDRLSIIIGRLGGRVGPVTMSPAERAEYGEWCSANGVQNGFL